jgi:hypothetical protein
MEGGELEQGEEGYQLLEVYLDRLCLLTNFRQESHHHIELLQAQHM